MRSIFSVSSVNNFFKNESGKLAAILLLALATRLMGISARPLWYDEVFSIFISQVSLSDMLYATLGSGGSVSADVHPVFYYALLGSWMRLFGESPLSARMLSSLFGLGIVLFVYLTGRRLIDPKFGLISAVLVAFAPFQVHYAQEVRMYAQMTFFILLAAWTFWRAMESGSAGDWFLFAVSAALAQYTHTLAGLFLLMIAFTPVLYRRKKETIAVILAGGFALLLYTPWLLELPSQLAFVANSYWVESPGASRLLTTLLSYVSNLPVPENWLLVALFVTLLCTAFGVWQTWRCWQTTRKMGASLTQDAPELHSLKSGLWLSYMAFGAPLLLFLISQWRPVYIERALLPAGVFYIMWIAWAFTRTKMPRIVSAGGFMLLFVGFGLGLWHHLVYDGFPYAPYASVADDLREIDLSDAVIVHSNKLSYFPLQYYARDLPQEYVADPPGSGADTLKLATQEVLRLSSKPDIEQAVGGAGEVWLVIFSQAIREYTQQGYDKHPHQIWLESQYANQTMRSYSDLFLIHYANEP